jgi:uncharacterized protein YlbG (UPF0298 family)
LRIRLARNFIIMAGIVIFKSCLFLELNGILISNHVNFILLKDPVSSFGNFIKHNKNDKSLLKLVESWNNRIKITLQDLTFTKSQEYIKEIDVEHRTDLKNKYLGHFVSHYNKEKHINILNDEQMTIIDKNKSVILYCNGSQIGAVIRDAAPKNLLNHFGLKIKNTTTAHYVIRRGKNHAAVGNMHAHGMHSNFFDGQVEPYAYKDKALNPDAQRMFDDDGNTLANWLYEYGRKYLPFATSSYDEFKEKVKLGDDEIIGAVFCTKDYEAIGHIDNDRSEFAVGYVYDEGIVKEGYFFYPEYGVAIELASNSIWCWKTEAVHGTAKLNLSEGGTRYTAVITLTEKTAKAIEKNYIPK